MWFDGDRKKKLIVAFHFSRSEETGNQGAGWNCEQCRRQGLEARRRCGFIAEDKRGPKRVVWTGGAIGIDECPKSYMDPRSLEWLERYFTWRLLGLERRELTARQAEAFLVIESELRSELTNGK